MQEGRLVALTSDTAKDYCYVLKQRSQQCLQSWDFLSQQELVLQSHLYAAHSCAKGCEI